MLKMISYVNVEKKNKKNVFIYISCFKEFLLTILTIGFWLMIFLVSIIPFWIGGAAVEAIKNKGKKIEYKP